MNDPAPKVVACADRMREVYRQVTSWKAILLLLLINLPFLALGWIFNAAWVQAVGMMGAGLFVVVPHILRIHRCLTHLPCPACGENVGSYFSLNLRYHLKCRHCGQVTPTDCGSLPGSPYKI